MISDEAVEAAAKAMWDDAKPVQVGVRPRWETVSNDPDWKHGVDSTRREARLALEAAAPYIAAEAWDEGRESVDFDSCGLNPYRSQA